MILLVISSTAQVILIMQNFVVILWKHKQYFPSCILCIEYFSECGPCYEVFTLFFFTFKITQLKVHYLKSFTHYLKILAV